MERDEREAAGRRAEPAQPMMRRAALLLLFALAACGGSDEADNAALDPTVDAQADSAAEIAADAELANRAAEAEAEDAAIGGNMAPEDVTAANLQ